MREGLPLVIDRSVYAFRCLCDVSMRRWCSPGKPAQASTKLTRLPGPSKPGRSCNVRFVASVATSTASPAGSGSAGLTRRTGRPLRGRDHLCPVLPLRDPHQDDHPLPALIFKVVELGLSIAHSANQRHPTANAHPPHPRSSLARGGDRHGLPHPRRPTGIRLDRHQSPARDPTRNAFHSSLENARIGPKGSFESRTSTAAPVIATSTQLPPPLAVLFFHRRGPCW